MTYMNWLEESLEGDGTRLLDIIEEGDGLVLELFETGSITVILPEGESKVLSLHIQ